MGTGTGTYGTVPSRVEVRYWYLSVELAPNSYLMCYIQRSNTKENPQLQSIFWRLSDCNISCPDLYRKQKWEFEKQRYHQSEHLSLSACFGETVELQQYADRNGKFGNRTALFLTDKIH